MKKMISLFLYFFFLISLNAQSPGNLTANISWSGGYNSISDIEGAYNNARREEEIQLGLMVNSLGNLTLPSNYNTLSNSEKALFIINDERAVRGGIDYGNGSCLGLPYENIENNLSDLAQGHADWLINNNAFTHVGANNLDPFERIDNDPILGTSAGCHEFISRAENLAGFWSSQSVIPFPIERAVYNWIYANSPAWGHRQTILLQNLDLSNNPWGYSNNTGTMSSEGFLGIGIAGANNGGYNPAGYGSWLDRGEVVVMKIMDPVDNPNCAYALPAALPIELIHFDAKIIQNQVELNWATASEFNNEYFILEHSDDGKTFEEIGIVNGNGFTETTSNYQFLHKNPLSGFNYYRLQQVDFDGTKTSSKIIAIRFINSFEVSLYPNPIITNDLTINILSKNSSFCTAHIFDGNNRLIKSLNVNLEEGLNQLKIKNEDLKRGMHTILLTSKDKVVNLRFSKI